MASKKTKKSSQVALGGIASGLCLLMMFMTGMIPFGEYALPAFAGIILIAVAIENGSKTATLVYFAVSLLGLFLVPVKESAMLFLFFFGYYPILQMQLNKIKVAPLRVIIKFVIFNVSIVASYFLIINLFGLTEILDEFGSFGQYSALFLLVFGNIFFLVYDFAVNNLNYVYINYFRPKFLRRVG